MSPYRPPQKQPQFADLKGVLSQSKKTDNALYQTVQILIERLTQFQGITVDKLNGLQGRTDDLEAGVGALTPSQIMGLGYWTPLTDGIEPNTELIFASGDCIAVFVPTTD